MDFDESWCPVCDRQIMPKRYQVPIPPPQPEQPAAPLTAPPSSPSSSSSKADATAAQPTRSKAAAGKARGGGLLQGTGRVRPNGAIKRTDSTSASKPPAQQSTKPAAPVKHRTVIDQGPIPLYCSDECRMQDIPRFDAAFPHDYNPDRESAPYSPVSPSNSYSQPETEDDSSSGSSLDSGLSSSSESNYEYCSPSIATLAAMYGWTLPPPSLPLPPKESTTIPEPEFSNDYQCGVMMAARRIKTALCPEPAPKRSIFSSVEPEPRKPVPGWTDGSDAWRSSVYNFTPIANKGAGASYVPALSHRKGGVPSRFGDSSASSAPNNRRSGVPPRRPVSSSTNELYAKFSEQFARRSESRTALFPQSSSSQSLPPLSPTSTTSSCHRKEVPILKPGAEGRLLVPDVKLRARTGSSYSVSSRSTRSPLARQPSESSADSAWNEKLDSPRPTQQNRSWSYDNVKTYPVMMPTPNKEKRIVKRVVDGEEKDVEIEVEVTPHLKRLFIFDDREPSSRSNRS
ncbi:hypothetical protein CONPUDRAFT_165236 [Coniophora puteana RWD-64-598 SS2]|uniref:Uncharacterized protein n=1 Tax=Coniophora puteana (strain RWD-64-598) TaxID=741705 RepID=A0A5M3MPL1_CONPW|nr:uncharacterized protein CONPUDRAFT_165236 [Coniophora puteana RWD-64-598 SS2]EIW81000.1 hypothetical protein CONPUDRAFT_165236 [Coniophora puteana RWD-64-598 SS2]